MMMGAAEDGKKAGSSDGTNRGTCTSRGVEPRLNPHVETSKAASYVETQEAFVARPSSEAAKQTGGERLRGTEVKGRMSSLPSSPPRLDVKSLSAPFGSYSHLQRHKAGHSEDTKGLNLLCDIGFPLGSHKQNGLLHISLCLFSLGFNNGYTRGNQGM
ncbi:hypothetical protein EYF80_038201 [Liparis tanakae]|uniref:Uncharacterized protein n=1 Tax=Liparis tanakae TaxID=230148 RepID=A0A4Z2GEN6_9TELE|nr:hypothetical protein EYF80_038201 [Liparis tanakae]